MVVVVVDPGIVVDVLVDDADTVVVVGGADVSPWKWIVPSMGCAASYSQRCVNVASNTVSAPDPSTSTSLTSNDPRLAQPRPSPNTWIPAAVAVGNSSACG